MSNSPFLTIGIASYNYSRYLRTALEAIRRQKFYDYEVLYCDDGSTDDSVAVIHALIDENPDMNIRLVCGANSGVMGNKNRIIENAQGKYLMLCDADDYMQDNCLETLCGLAIETDADQVVGAFQQLEENGNLVQVQEIPKNLSRWTWGTHHATLYKMQVIKDNHIRFDMNSYPDDMYFNMVFHDNSRTQVYTNKVLYNWIVHGGSTSDTKVKEDNWHGYPLLESCLSYIKPVADKYIGDEKQQIEYTAVKMYCMANLYRYGGSLKRFLKGYKKMHKLMISAFPEYERNTYAKNVNGGGIVRKPTANAIWMFVLSERMHIIYAVLTMYWIVAKFKKFAV